MTKNKIHKLIFFTALNIVTEYELNEYPQKIKIIPPIEFPMNYI